MYKKQGKKQYFVTVTVEVERIYIVRADSEEEAKNPEKWKDLSDSMEGEEVFQNIELDEYLFPKG